MVKISAKTFGMAKQLTGIYVCNLTENIKCCDLLYVNIWKPAAQIATCFEDKYKLAVSEQMIRIKRTLSKESVGELITAPTEKVNVNKLCETK